MSDKFETDKNYGGFGEHTVWNWLMNQKWVRSVVDVREDKEYQAKDIDFLVENFERQFTSFEVKTDFQAHETGNIVYEVTTNGHIGCFEKTQAKIIAYYLPKAKRLHLINVIALRTYIHEKQPEPKTMGDNAKGFLIPLGELKKEKVILNTYEGVM